MSRPQHLLARPIASRRGIWRGRNQVAEGKIWARTKGEIIASSGRGKLPQQRRRQRPHRHGALSLRRGSRDRRERPASLSPTPGIPHAAARPSRSSRNIRWRQGRRVLQPQTPRSGHRSGQNTVRRIRGFAFSLPRRFLMPARASCPRSGRFLRGSWSARWRGAPWALLRPPGSKAIEPYPCASARLRSWVPWVCAIRHQHAVPGHALAGQPHQPDRHVIEQ